MENIYTIISKYDSEEINVDHVQRENLLRYQNNIRRVFGLKINERPFLRLLGIKELNRRSLLEAEILASTRIIGNLNFSSQCIFVTLHLGCYHLIGTYLSSIGMKFCVPVTHRVFTEQVSNYQRSFKSLGVLSSIENIKFIDVENRIGLFEIIRYIKEGYSLLCYIDGNSGIGGMGRNDGKLLKIKFFNTYICARRGVEFLSTKYHLDIVPLYSYIDEILNVSVINILPKIQINENETGKIWHAFYMPIFRYFDQWEAFQYIDEYLSDGRKYDIEGNGYYFNNIRYAPVIKSDRCYFYDRKQNVLVKTSHVLYNILFGMMSSRTVLSLKDIKKIIPKKSLMHDLLEFQLLIKNDYDTHFKGYND
jgi:hypothetical protein